MRICKGVGRTLFVRDMESAVYREMCEKMDMYQQFATRNDEVSNPRFVQLNTRLQSVENNIEKLLDSLMQANDAVMKHVNKRVAELDSQRNGIIKEISAIKLKQTPAKEVLGVSELLKNWEDVGFAEKRDVVEKLINRVKVTSEAITIEWRI